MTEDPRKTSIGHLKIQRTFQHITNEILPGYNPNKRISRRPPPINLPEYQSHIYNLEIPGLSDRKADVNSTVAEINES